MSFSKIYEFLGQIGNEHIDYGQEQAILARLGTEIKKLEEKLSEKKYETKCTTCQDIQYQRHLGGEPSLSGYLLTCKCGKDSFNITDLTKKE